MKYATFLLSAVIAATPVCANAAMDKKAYCVDPHWGYEAHAINHNEIIIRRSLGHERPELKLETTCFDLDRTSAIAVSSAFTCVDRGDIIVATNLGGPRQSCRITNVAPYVHTAPAAKAN